MPVSTNCIRFVATGVIGIAAWSPLRAEVESRRVGDLVFEESLYPGLASVSDDELRLAGIAALYPGRIRHGVDSAVVAVPEVRKTVVVKLPGGVDYVRPYDFMTDDLVARVGKVPLIVDCRYLASDHSRLPDVRRMGEALRGGRPVVLDELGRYSDSGSGSTAASGAGESPATTRANSPVLVLVNGATSGPIEAVLSALQRQGDVELVGVASAGSTGRFLPPVAGRSVLAGEIRAARGESLLGVGVTPAHRVDLDPKAEFLVWQLMARGVSPASMLGRDVAPPAALGDSAAHDAAAGVSSKTGTGLRARDVTLRRAADIHEAKRVLSGSALSSKSEAHAR